MAPRLSGQTSLFGVVFFVSKSLLGIKRQKKLEKFAILTRKPRSHARILIYRTWPIPQATSATKIKHRAIRSLFRSAPTSVPTENKVEGAFSTSKISAFSLPFLLAEKKKEPRVEFNSSRSVICLWLVTDWHWTETFKVLAASLIE